MPPERTVYVLVYPSRVFAAHWSLWIPYPIEDDNPDSPKPQECKSGDRIHVTGDRLNGFQYEYIQNYTPSADKRYPDLHVIGRVKDEALGPYDVNNDTDAQLNASPNTEDGNGTISSTIVNKFDETCRGIEAPGPSLNPVVTTVSRGAAPPLGPPPAKREVLDCQWWIREVVPHLVGAGLLLPVEEGDEMKTPPALVGKLPRH